MMGAGGWIIRRLLDKKQCGLKIIIRINLMTFLGKKHNINETILKHFLNTKALNGNI